MDGLVWEEFDSILRCKFLESMDLPLFRLIHLVLPNDSKLAELCLKLVQERPSFILREEIIEVSTDLRVNIDFTVRVGAGSPDSVEQAFSGLKIRALF